MSEKLNIKDINFIDLFAGCGGLSEGFYKEGFNALAHVEIEPKACMSLRTRMKHYGYTDYDISKPFTEQAKKNLEVLKDFYEAMKEIFELMKQACGIKEGDSIQEFVEQHQGILYDNNTDMTKGGNTNGNN